ncbi:hypothetical protein GW17_00051711 [Ensete ventricosum]|nr:hypothetical protein GW17_00051711 [Ensete ventricosum]
MRSDGLPCEILCVGGSTKQERAGQKSGGHEAAKRYADVDQWKEVLYWWLGHDRCPALGAFSEAGPRLTDSGGILFAPFGSPCVRFPTKELR